MSEASLRRLRFYAGNAYRFATIPWRQRVIAPEEACNIFACSYGDDGWHHLRRTLLEYDRDASMPCSHTTLYRYLTAFSPASICDLIDPPLSGACALPLFVYPWGTFRRGETSTTKERWTSRFCGPSTEKFVAEEHERMISLYERMKMRGYRPWSFGHTFIGGTFLIAEDGRRRFVVLQGNHRMAVLAHLGCRRIAVRDVSGNLATVRERDLREWALVRAGVCNADVARAVFKLFFQQTGWQVADRISRREAA